MMMPCSLMTTPAQQWDEHEHEVERARAASRRTAFAAVEAARAAAAVVRIHRRIAGGLGRGGCAQRRGAARTVVTREVAVEAIGCVRAADPHVDPRAAIDADTLQIGPRH